MRYLNNSLTWEQIRAQGKGLSLAGNDDGEDQGTHCKMQISTQTQISRATSSPSVPWAKELSWGSPFKSSPGRKEFHCPAPCVTVPKPLSRTCHDVSAWSYQLPQFFSFLISAKESDGDISLYHTFKHEAAKQDLTESFQWMQSHRHLNFIYNFFATTFYLLY